MINVLLHLLCTAQAQGFVLMPSDQVFLRPVFKGKRREISIKNRQILAAERDCLHNRFLFTSRSKLSDLL